MLAADARQRQGADRWQWRWLGMLGIGFCLGVAAAPAAPPKVIESHYFFSRIGNPGDLAQNTVNALLQDRDGFLWIGTQGGLHRYDGYEFLRFQHRAGDADSLPDSFVTALAEDAEGRLFVGSNRHGLAVRQPGSPRFVVVPPGEGERNRREVITVLLADGDEGIWVGSHFGLEHLANNGRRSDILRLPPSAEPEASVRDLARCADGTLYAATSAGLFRVNAGSTRARGLPLPRAADAAMAVHCDATGALWLSSGLRLFERQNASWRLAFDGAANLPQIAHYAIVRIREDLKHQLWLATDGLGLIKFLPTESRSEWLRHQQRAPGGLPEDALRSLLVDRSGLLWVGGNISGVARARPEGAPFTSVIDDSSVHGRINTNNVRAILADADRGLWLGTEGDGLKYYDFAKRAFSRFGDVLGRALGLPAAPADLRVYAIQPARQAGQLWLATDHGAFLFDPAQQVAQALPVDRQRDDALPSADIRSLIVGRDGSVWLGSLSSGLSRYRPELKQWQHFPVAVNDQAAGLWHPAVMALHEDAHGHLWIGTIGGLNVLDLASGVMHKVSRAESANGLVGEVVRVITESADGSLWVGTHNGLNRLLDYHAGQPTFEHFLSTDGLANETIYGILEDQQRRLWVSTNGGISRLHRQTTNTKANAASTPRTTAPVVRNFSLDDGLQGLEFNGGAYAKLADGRLVFGGTQGFSWVAPDQVRDPDYRAPLAFTAFQLGSQRTLIEQPAAFKKLVLSANDHLLILTFAALDLNAPEHNRFAYRLLGYDRDWIELGTRHELSLTHLDAGNYPLQIRGGHGLAPSAGPFLELAIQVTPPWWRAPWVLAVSALLLLGWLLTWLWNRRRRLWQLKAQNTQMKLYSERLSSALWASRDGFWDWNLETDLLYMSGPEEFLGPSREARISGQQWRQHSVHADDLSQVEAALEAHITDRSDYYEAEFRANTYAGKQRWVVARGRAVRRNDQGHALQVAGTFRDVTDERALDRDRRIAQEVIRSMGEVVCVSDLEFRFVSVNAAFTRVTGYSAEEILGQDAAVLNSEQHPLEFYLQIRQALQQSAHWSGEAWQSRKGGEQFLSALEINEVAGADGRRLYWVAVLTDITDRKRAEQELRYLANYDTLTGLPNRTLLGERLAHSLIRARRLGNKVGILFLDLDHFKHVNDSMGHAAGDRLLKAAAARIVMSVRDSDTVARLGGDEFTVVLEDLTDLLEAERIARKLIVSFETPLEIDGRNEVVISPSIGITLYPEHGQVPTDLLKHADTAMYHAKDRGRNTYQVYTDAMDAQVRFRASMGNQLHKALERGELRVVYQPKLALIDQHITGAEALLRWYNPVLGEISPTTFVPIAEETGLIVPIGEWVIRQACEQIQRWTAVGINQARIAVNVSAMQLFRGELFSRMQQILNEYGVAANRIEIELTESMLMASPEQSIATLTQIRALGVHIAVDDFGTGYSSLAYLKRLPINSLKIDQTFVADLTIDPDDETIIATVIMMAHSLGLNVIAEGVETAEQKAFLAEQQCDEIQGHLVAQPLDANRMLQFLIDHQPRPSVAP